MGVFNLEGLRIANGVGFNFDGNVVSLIELMMLHIVSALSLRLTRLTKNSICSYCISFFFCKQHRFFGCQLFTGTRSVSVLFCSALDGAFRVERVTLV